MVLNRNGKAIYANRVALEYTGLSLDEVCADSVRDRVFHSSAIVSFEINMDAIPPPLYPK